MSNASVPRAPRVFREEDVFLPFAHPRERISPAAQIRSTWLSSSVQALREHGLFDRYIAFLPSEHHRVVLESIAGVWIPMSVGIAHYRACDRLGLAKRETFEIGVQVTRKVHGTTLGLAIGLAKQSGVTPWTILAQLGRLWSRIYQGGGVAVYRRGPKEAVIDVVGWPLASIGYVRQSMPAVVVGVVEMFCTKAYATDLPDYSSASSLALKLQWA